MHVWFNQYFHIWDCMRTSPATYHLQKNYLLHINVISPPQIGLAIRGITQWQTGTPLIIRIHNGETNIIWIKTATRIYLVLFVLSCVRKTRNDSSDTWCWRNLAGVDHNQKFHDHVIDFAATTLNNEHILSTNRLTNLDATSVQANHYTDLHDKT